MKKTFTFLAFAAFLFLSSDASAWKSKKNYLSYDVTSIQGDKGITEGGFYLHYTPFLPSSKYLFPKEVTSSSGTYGYGDSEIDDLRDYGKFGFGHGLAIGNMFRLVDSDPLAIGLRVTWFSFGWTVFKPSSSYDISGFAVNLNALKLGPYVTYALNDQMAVDAFYQVSPTLNLGAVAGTDNNNNAIVLPIVGAGLAHELGVTYRFDILSVGVGYGLGSTKVSATWDDGSGSTETVKAKYNNSHMRIMLGMKF